MSVGQNSCINQVTFYSCTLLLHDDHSAGLSAFIMTDYCLRVCSALTDIHYGNLHRFGIICAGGLTRETVLIDSLSYWLFWFAMMAYCQLCFNTVQHGKCLIF